MDLLYTPWQKKNIDVVTRNDMTYLLGVIPSQDATVTTRIITCLGLGIQN